MYFNQNVRMNGKEGITEFVRVRYNLPLQKDAELFEKDTEVLKKDTELFEKHQGLFAHAKLHTVA